MVKLYFVCAFVCSLFSFGLYSQSTECNHVLQGRITDEHDSSPLSFSTIAVIESGKGSISDEQGFYSLEGLCKGTYHIVIRHVGCESDTVEVRISQDIQQKDFQLEHHAELLEQVDVLANSSDHTGKLSEKEMEESRGMLLGDMLESISGLNALKTGPNVSKPMVNGLSGNRLQIVSNNVELQSQQWGDEHSPELDPFVTTGFSLLRGASALKYGGIGGAIVAKEEALPTKNGIGGSLHLIAADNMGMGNISGKVESKLSKLPNFSWRIQGSLKKSGNIKTADYYLKNTGMEEYNFSYLLGYKKQSTSLQLFYSQFNSNLGIFSGAHIENLSDFKEAIQRNEPRAEDSEGFSYEIRRPYQHVEHEVVGIKTLFDLNASNKLEMVLSRQFNKREEYDKHLPRNADAEAAEMAEFALNLTTLSFDANWTSFASSSKTELGLQMFNKQNTLSGTRDFIPEYLSNSLSLYGIKKWYLDKFEWEVALRYNFLDMDVYKVMKNELTEKQHTFHSLNVAAGVNYLFGKSTKLSLNALAAQRPPAINELYSEGLHHGTASMEFGINSLKKENLWELNAHFRHEKAFWAVELFAYNKYFNDFIYLQPDGVLLSIQGAFPQYLWKQADAHLWGLDLQNSLSFNKLFQLQLAAHYLKAVNLEEKQALPFMPPIELDAKLQYEFASNKSPKYLALEVERVFEQKDVPESELLAAPDAYTLLHFHAGIKPKFKENRLSINLSIKNIGNTSYRNYLDRMRYFADAQGRTVWLKIQYLF